VLREAALVQGDLSTRSLRVVMARTGRADKRASFLAAISTLTRARAGPFGVRVGEGDVVDPDPATDDARVTSARRIGVLQGRSMYSNRRRNMASERAAAGLAETRRRGLLVSRAAGRR